MKVIDLEEMITAKELMELHKLERSILGRQGFKVIITIKSCILSERKIQGRVFGQLAFRPAPTEKMRDEGLVILKRKRHELRKLLRFRKSV